MPTERGCPCSAGKLKREHCVHHLPKPYYLGGRSCIVGAKPIVDCSETRKSYGGPFLNLDEWRVLERLISGSHCVSRQTRRERGPSAVDRLQRRLETTAEARRLRTCAWFA